MEPEQWQRRQMTPEQREELRQRRTESRASSTYKQFLKDLTAGGAFQSEAEAEQAALAVLCALEQRLTYDEARKLESQLPSKLRELLVQCDLHADLLPRDIKRSLFLQLVGEHAEERLDPLRATRTVFETLAKHITAGEIHKVIHQLPGDLRELWPEWARAAEEHRPMPSSSRSQYDDTESAPEVVNDLLKLPVNAQLGVIRTVLPRVLASLSDTERDGFLRDVGKEVSLAVHGEIVYDLRPESERHVGP